jgi:REP element-mobilizing transposase RayT
MPGPERTSPRLGRYDYTSPGAYFVTVCARDRACLFGTIVDDKMRENRLGRIVADCWTALPNHFPLVELDAFVVMPNHLHGIVWLPRAGHAPPLPRLIGSVKSAASRAAGNPLWQRSFYDRVIRNETELRLLRQYIAENPLRWALDRENPSRG